MADCYMGTSCASIVEAHFQEVIGACDVDVRSGGHEPAELIRTRYWARLTIQRSLPPAEALEAVGVQLGLLVLGYLKPGQAPHWELPDYARTCRRQWLAALRWAACHLIRDGDMVFAEAQGWCDERLAAEAGVSRRLAQARIQEYARATGRDVPFFAL